MLDRNGNQIVYKKNDYRDVDEMVYNIRLCMHENGLGCGTTVYCKCDEQKTKLLEFFNPLIFHLIDYHARFNNYCYSFKSDFEQDLKGRFVELIYNWDDKRGIYFVTYASIMLYKWMLKIHNTEINWNKRKFDNFMLYDIMKPDKHLDKSIKQLHAHDNIYGMMKNLTAKQRAVVEARYLNHLMVNEISNMMRISPGAVSNLLKRAYKTFKEEIDKSEMIVDE